MTPAAIDKYEILESLGKGSMGVVYKARDPEIGRLVAIKTLRNVYLGGEGVETEALKRFRQESRSAGRLRHPNIVTIFEAGRGEDGSPYIVMEFIEGKSLEEMIAERAPLAPQEALHYLAQVASALDYAHSQNVIHRDIKPSNVIVDTYNKPHLLDFGVAKLSDTSLTPAGTVVGTPSYMSPEQIKGEELKGSSDLFALAVLTFELFTGSRPFPGKDFTTVVNNIIHKEPVSFQDLGIGLPAPLEAVLRKGLAKDWRDRPTSVLQFVSDVAQVFSLPVDGMGLIGGYRPEMASAVGTVVSPRPAIQAQNAQVNGATSNAAVGTQAASIPPTPKAPAQQSEQAVMTGIITEGQVRPDREQPAAVNVSLNPVAPRDVPGSSKSLWVVLSLVLLIGGGAGAYLLTGGKLPTFVLHSGGHSDSDESATEEAADETGDSQKPVEANPIVVSHGAGGETDLGGTSASAAKASDSPASSLPSLFSPPALADLAQLPTQPSMPLDTISSSNVNTLKDGELLYVLDAPAAPEPTLRAVIDEAGKRTSAAITVRLLKLSQHPSFVVRVDALKALARDGHRQNPATLGAVVARLADDDFLVRGFSAKLVAQLGDRTLLPVLKDRLAKEDNEKVKAVLQQAIEKISQ